MGWLNANNPEYDAAFREGLLEHGYVEGENISIEARQAESEDQLAALADELLRLNPDVIVAAGGIQALRNATSTIPIVIALTTDPVEEGFVASLARPGGNVTGLSAIVPQLNAKRLQLLKEAAPAIARVGVVWNPPTTPPGAWRELPNAAQTLGVELQSLEVREPDDLDELLLAVSRERIEALLFLGGSFESRHAARFGDLKVRSHLPSMSVFRRAVELGGLMAYGANLRALVRRAAYYVDRILKGAKPADLPVEQPMTFEFVVNLKTAQALGITFPNEIMLQVTEVID